MLVSNLHLKIYRPSNSLFYINLETLLKWLFFVYVRYEGPNIWYRKKHKYYWSKWLVYQIADDTVCSVDFCIISYCHFTEQNTFDLSNQVGRIMALLTPRVTTQTLIELSHKILLNCFYRKARHMHVICCGHINYIRTTGILELFISLLQLGVPVGTEFTVGITHA